MYFPDRTAEQIRAKYTQMKKSHEIVNNCIQRVKDNNVHTKEQLSELFTKQEL